MMLIALQHAHEALPPRVGALTQPVGVREENSQAHLGHIRACHRSRSRV
ncbi:Hypothetical protein AA314_01476 [Archangium gephyra]|uniref:Uncharacterized protein n=1 Tax=Archangium gephyra TaxID=48 RepID=A0AAC8TBH1_9BACT|nr:Hypothetical protein AA314_01476 [Archangium gephyra]